MSNNSSGSRTAPAAVERKEIERKRRQEMRRLCVKLASLLPEEQHSSRDTLSQVGSMDKAAAYIKKLKESVDALQQKRSSLQLVAAMRGGAAGVSTSVATTTSGDAGSEDAADDDEAVAAPVVEVRQHNDGSNLDVVLISSVERPFKLHEVVTVLEEEGAEIVNANFSVTGQQIFHTIHCRAFCSRIGIEVARVSERLRALVGSMDKAAAYIKKLKESVDALQQKRSSLQLVAAMRGGAAGVSTSVATTTSGDAGSEDAADDDEAVAAPVVEVRQHNDGSNLDVVLISSVERPFKLHEVVTVLEEEGAEIVNANFSVTGQQIFHTIHCRAFCSRIGIEVARVSERLRALV